ncbi:P22AR C-terminal domain-containing protein [Pasteurella multocida]|uniref:P22AR C-terminal domain-containing protein n=1 Tax=Pasteurella multocida TaxID=747 RepID=UPI003CFB44D8
MTTLSFQNTSLSVINQNNQIWFSALDIGKALGYSNGDIGVKNIYNRHQDEFTPCMTALIDTQTNGGIQKMRIFSLRGTHLIGMLSHTKVAKDFRKWVLDILDRETNQPQQLALPEPEKKYTFSFTEYELQQLAWAWFAFSRCTETLRKLYSPLQKLGSHFAPKAYGQGMEYYRLVQSTNDTINRITKDFKCVSNNNWRVLEHVRNFDKNAIVYNQIHD